MRATNTGGKVNTAIAATVAFAIGLTWTFAQSRAETARLAPTGKSAAGSEKPAATKLRLGIGDRLKISFFEMVDVAGRESAPALHTFYQRMDLSGEFTVDQDGVIAFPRLGRFQVDGRAPADLQSELSAAFLKTMGREADISVTILERPPVYVVGPVKNPGVYKYVSGMMVLHAIALAGGLEQGLGGASAVIEGVREMERLRKAADDMKRLLARSARLRAERDRSDVVQPPPELIALAGVRAAQELVATETAILRAERVKKQQQQNEIAASIKAAQGELEVLRRKLAQVDVQKDLRLDRLKDLQKLKDVGTATSNTVIVIRSEISDLDARREDHLLSTVQVEARLAQAEQAAAKFASDQETDLIKAIASTDQEIADLQQTLASTDRLAGIIEESNSKISRTSSLGASVFEIVRQTRDGSTVLQVQETSALMPGDVLKISQRSASAQEIIYGPRRGGAASGPEAIGRGEPRDDAKRSESAAPATATK